MAWLPSSRTNYLERKWGDRSAPSRCLWNKPRFYWPSLLAKFEYIVLLLWLFPFDGLINLFSIVPSPLVAHFCNTQKADPKPFILIYIYTCIYMVTWCVYVCSPAPFLSLTLRQQLTSCWRHFALGRQQWRTFALYTHVCSVLSWALHMYVRSKFSNFNLLMNRTDLFVFSGSWQPLPQQIIHVTYIIMTH
jgi:hypothetical protein